MKEEFMVKIPKGIRKPLAESISLWKFIEALVNLTLRNEDKAEYGVFGANIILELSEMMKLSKKQTHNLLRFYFLTIDIADNKIDEEIKKVV